MTSKRERRKEFQDFVRLIDFGSLPLLDDTVTEVILDKTCGPHDTTVTLHETEGITNCPFSILAGDLRYTIREDPLRVSYPSCRDFPSFRHISTLELSEEVEITDGVFKVFQVKDKTPYILKVVNRSFYQPHDTDVIRKELENLAIFQGVSNIVQAAGVAVSTNPYTTSNDSDQPSVVTGILLEFHSGGSLQRVLDARLLMKYPWERWTIQIASALACLHRARITHMDLKPSNIVLDADGNAVFIDISGIGGITHNWRAPEIRDEISTHALPFEARQFNDLWAYGKLLSEIVSQAEESPFASVLQHIARCLTKENPESRMTLLEAISRLEAAGVDKAKAYN